MANVTPEEQARKYRYYIEPKQVSDLTRSTLVLVLAGGLALSFSGGAIWPAPPQLAALAGAANPTSVVGINANTSGGGGGCRTGIRGRGVQHSA